MSTTQDPSTVVPNLPPAGWYPDGQANGQVRYFDGQSWTEHTAPAAGQGGVSAPAVEATAEKKSKKPSRKVLIIGGSVAAALALIISISAINDGSGSAEADIDKPAATTSEGGFSQESKKPAAKPDVAMPDLAGKTVDEARAELNGIGLTLSAPDGTGGDWLIIAQTEAAGTMIPDGGTVTITGQAPPPPLTLAQENALESAQSYLSHMAFSRQGLIDQLSSEYGEGYPLDVATWAADTVGADWNAEAVESATSYLDHMSFSRDGLYDQLTSEYGEGFTPEQANHALAAVGY